MFRKGFGLLAVGALCFTGLLGGAHFSSRTSVHAKEPLEDKPRGKVAYVNLAEVLKGYTRANTRGQKIADLRQTYVQEVAELRNKLVELNMQNSKEKDEKVKDELREAMTKVQRRMEDIDRNAQKELTEMSNKVIIDVHNEISQMVAEIARESDLDSVLVYPGLSANQPITHSAAQMVLQSNAAYPMYIRKELNLTEDVLKRLNKKYPASSPTSNKRED